MKNYGWIFFSLLIGLVFCTSSRNPSAVDRNGSPLNEPDLESMYSTLNQADSLYQKQNYKQAIRLYRKLFSELPHIVSVPEYRFKIGYGYFMRAQYDSAALWLNKCLRDRTFGFKDYASFLIGKSLQELGYPDEAVGYFKKSEKFTRNRYLKTDINWQLVKIKQNQSPDSAWYYLHMVKYAYLSKYREEYVALKLKLLKKDNTGKATGFAVKMMKYDWHTALEDSLFAVLYDSLNALTVTQKIDILKILAKKLEQKYFDIWYNFLSESSGIHPDQMHRIRFVKAVKLYKNRKWQSCNLMLKKINSAKLNDKEKGDYALYLARCQARLGFMNSAIRAYFSFQKKFPKHPLAGDALWWIALTYEQRKDFRKAEKYYNLLAKKYLKKDVGKEAAFRLIFNDIKQHKYSLAVRKINKILKKVDYDTKFRLSYWKMYALERNGKKEEALKVKDFLLSDPFQNYYSLKVFLEHYKDSLAVFKNLAPYKVPSPYELSGELRFKIDKILQINELMGKEYARIEIKDLLIEQRSNKIYRLILADLHNKLANYGEAFRLNRRNYEKYFLGKQWNEKIGYIKTLYPLYYSRYVFPLSAKRQVDPFLVYALMKRESLFNESVKSYADAYGLMQILPGTAKTLARRMGYDKYEEALDLYEPEININLGIFYLSNLLKQFDNYIPAVLASYNAGESRVKKWMERYRKEGEDDLFIELIPIGQTRAYVKYILYYYYVYQWFYRLNEGIHYYEQPEFIMKIPGTDK